MSALPPESGHVQCSSRCPLWANSGHEGQLDLVTFFEQSERATQRIRRRLALITGHAVDFKFEPQMGRISLFDFLVQFRDNIGRDRLGNAFDFYRAALFTAHVISDERISLERHQYSARWRFMLQA